MQLNTLLIRVLERALPKSRESLNEQRSRFRYGGKRYELTCAKAAKATHGRCTDCGVNTISLKLHPRSGLPERVIGELHHLQYFSKWRWVKDAYAAATGNPPAGVWGGITPDRENIGINAVHLCRRCHDKAHQSKHWRRAHGSDKLAAIDYPSWIAGFIAPAYRNRNRLIYQLRLRILHFYRSRSN